MNSARSPFVRQLIGNLRLSAIVCVIALAALGVYSLIVDKSVMWDIVVFLTIGMAISSLFNAWADARRNRKWPG